MNTIPIREMIRNAVTDLGGKANYTQIIELINKKHGAVNNNTIRTQIMACSVNSFSRIHLPECGKPRSFDARYDFLYNVGPGQVVLYDPIIHGNWTLIEHQGKTVIAKDGVPANLIPSDSSLMLFLLNKMQMNANYQPIVIKTLLEKGIENSFSASLDEIKEKINLLNFDRQFSMTDAIKSVSVALKEYVVFDDDKVSLQVDFISPHELKKCLKICGQKIAQWHIDKITEREYEMWHVMPGSADEGFPFLDEFFQTSSIGVGWHKIGNIANLSESEIKQKFTEQYVDDGGWQGLLDFSKIKPKDIVVLTKGQQVISDFGIVVGNYEFRDVAFPSYPHKKQVIWLNRGHILPKDLPNPTLAGFIDTCGKLVKRKQEMIDVLLEKNTMQVKDFSYFILTQNPDSKYDDVEGEQYQYDNNKPNSRQLTEGSKCIIQSKINGENFFIGIGQIGNIEESNDFNENGKPITKFVAKFSDYQKFDQPKPRTSEIYEEMKSMKAYGSQPPSILPITRQLYAMITGKDSDDEIKTVEMKPNYSRIIEILKRKKNIILYGPPGTGKTHESLNIIEEFTKSNIPKIAICFPSDRGIEKIKKFQELISENKKLLWGVGWDIPRLQESDYPVKGYVYFRGNIIAIANITKISEHKNTNSYDLQLRPKGLGYDQDYKYYLHIDELEICEPFSHKKLQLSDKTKEMPETIQQRVYVDQLNQFTKFVTFHQSYGYEEFIEGIRPKSTEKGIIYQIEGGVFKQFCNDARNDAPENNYVLIIDEINRGNISKIFGELITIIEKDKREKSVTLAYSKENFSVPKNIYVIGTMNTADQSLTHMDAALKRRFSLVEVMPNPSLLKTTKSGIPLRLLLEKINERIIIRGSRDNQIGHSYFMDDGKSIETTEELQFVFATDIIPLLRDYFYDDEDSLKEILGGQFIKWGDPHRDMDERWQKYPDVFIDTLKDAFGIQIGSN